MTKRVLAIFGVVVVGSIAGLGVSATSAQTPRLPAGVKSSFDTLEAPVLKVFSAEEGEHRFVAYLVKWKGFEVIVSDALARSNFKVGDTISFMAHKITLRRPPTDVSSLSFMLMESAPSMRGGAEPGGSPASTAEQKRMMRITQGDLGAARNEAERFYALNRAAKTALKEGRTEEARKLAKELERLAPKYRSNWNYGNAIQDANQVLGLIALSEGDVAEAKKRLLASADSKGSPQMNSFGPNMQLAKDLLAKGERDVVLEYFERCGKFWEMGADRLSAWTDSVNRGETPKFGANLRY